MRQEIAHSSSWRSEVWLALGFVVLALVLRSPALAYSAINYDESMYVLMGAEILRGHLPYTTLCDLKPFGLFGLFGLIAALPGDDVVNARIVASLVVGFTAWMLARVAALLFDDEARAIGLVAGTSYAVFSLATGGLSSQGELFHNACAVLALWLALGAINEREPPPLGRMAAAGLALGVGLQIKQSVLFDMAAFLVGFFLLRSTTSGSAVNKIRSSIPAVLVVGVTSLLPTAAVILTYALAGHLDAWVAGNITAHRVFYGLDRPFAWEEALRLVLLQGLLWLPAAAGLAAGPWLARTGRERRACAFLAIWVGAVALGQLFLRIAAEHYFLQFLPPLGLLAGLALGRGLLLRLRRPAWRTAALAALVLLALLDVGRDPIMNAVLMTRERLRSGNPTLGDTPRSIAALLRPRLERGDSIYVIGFQPIVYRLTGAEIATRFAFTGLPSARIPGRDGCPWVELRVEMTRILDSQPRFIVAEDGVFLHELDPAVRGILTERLERDYRHLARFDIHPIHHRYPFDAWVMNGGAAADVYELRPETPVASGG
jgi:hypothetical protein